MTDRLDLANAFEGAGIERRAAERLADEVFAAIRENVAAKPDVEALRGEIREAELRLRNEIQGVEVRLLRAVETRASTIIGAVAAIVGLAAALSHLFR